MPDYKGFFLNSPSRVVRLETFQLYHPSFTRTYFIVRNATRGLVANLENGSSVTFEYYPVKIEKNGFVGDLDFGIDISFGDLGEIIPTELDRIRAAGTSNVKPTITYREYRSDDLSAPMMGPLLLQVKNFSFNREGATMQAAAPALNINKTGIIYSLSGPFRTLRSFL